MRCTQPQPRNSQVDRVLKSLSQAGRLSKDMLVHANQGSNFTNMLSRNILRGELSSSNSAKNPLVPLRDTSTKVLKQCRGANNFIRAFYNDLVNVTYSLNEFFGDPASLMNPQRCMARSATSRGMLVARTSRWLRSTSRTVLDTCAILEIVGPALANAIPPSYCDLANAMRAHTTDNGGLVPTCAIPTFSSTVCVVAFIGVLCKLRRRSAADSDVRGPQIQWRRLGQRARLCRRTASRILWRSSLMPQASEQWRSLWVALLLDAADKEQAFVSRIASCKNLGDGDKQTEDDQTSIDLKEYVCVWERFATNGTTTQILRCWSAGKRVKTFTLDTQI